MKQDPPRSARQARSPVPSDLAVSSFAALSFTPRVQRLLQRTRNTRIARDATPSEIATFSEEVRSSLGTIADGAVIDAVARHNPSVFQVLADSTARDRPLAFNAALPLTEEGARALLTGALDPLAPRLEYIAKPGDAAAAIYVWLIWSPGSFIYSLKALSDYMVKLAPGGCALFCRGATVASEAFMREIGYEDASHFYPGAPAGLLCVHPVRDILPRQTPPAVQIELARSMNDILQIFAIRAATYMADQQCPYAEEFDGNDFCAAHFIGHIGGEPAGCLRIRFFDGFVKFERLAVRREYRTSKLAFRLVREAMRYAGTKGYRRVYGHARHDLVRFWRSFGFRPLSGSPCFSFSDVDYVEMSGEIAPATAPLRIGDSPYRLIRPEGRWDEPGPLERASDPNRAAALADQWRTPGRRCR